MPWFIKDLDPAVGWKVTLLGLIPWLGKQAITTHLEAMALSPLFFLPRIVPGPQVLTTPEGFWADCRKRAPEIKANVGFGCCHFGHHPQDTVYMACKEMKSAEHSVPFSINFWEFRHKDDMRDSRTDNLKDGADRVPQLRRFSIVIVWFQQTLKLLTRTEVMILISFLVTGGLIILSALQKDGPALVALVLLSLQSMGCHFNLRSKARYICKRSSDGTHRIIIKTPRNAFWVIVCDRLSLRAILDGNCSLFEEPHQLRHPGGVYPTCALFFMESNITMGMSFVLLSTAKFIDQMCIAGAYIFLTTIYWIVQAPGVTPPHHIMASRLYYPQVLESHLPGKILSEADPQPSLARTIWYLLRITRSAAWVRSIQAIPEEAGWDEWLKEAVTNMFVDDWPAEAEKRRLVDLDNRVYDEELEVAQEDAGETAIEIQPVPTSQW